MPNLGLGSDFTADVGDVLFVLNLVALAIYLLTIHLDRIERGADWLAHHVHKLRCTAAKRPD